MLRMGQLPALFSSLVLRPFQYSACTVLSNSPPELFSHYSSNSKLLDICYYHSHTKSVFLPSNKQFE